MAVLVMVHAGRWLLSPQNDEWLLLALAFIPDRYSTEPLPWPGGAISAWTSPVTHMLLHGDATHLLLNTASLLAFGGVLARRMSPVRFLAFAVFSGLAGVLLFWVFNMGARAPLIGASGAIAGMMAAALRLLFSAIDRAPSGLAGEFIRRAPQLIPIKPLFGVLTDRRIFIATAVWLAINLMAAFGLGTPGVEAAIAWEAHIGGYFAGLLGFGMFDDGTRWRPEPASKNQNQTFQ